MSANRAVVAVLAGVVGLSLLIVVVLIPAGEDACTPEGGGAGGGARWPTGSVVKPVDPARVVFTSGFGPRGGAAHQGIDLAGEAGTPIYAYTDGVVAEAKEASGFGNWIVLDHNVGGRPVSTVYGHIFAQDLLVHTGDRVRAGQHIANIGFAGEVSPPGPGGAHLHFEIWEGGTRLGGGHAVDPKPAYDTAPAPGNPAAVPDHTPTPVPAPAPPAAGAELAALPAQVGDESHWQIDTIRVARAVHAVFPQITRIGGYRPKDSMPDHPSGRAADITIPDYTSGEGIALGDAVVDYLLSNANEFNIEYLIWRQTYIPAHGERSRMPDRGGDTANHYDHLHVTTVGHGFPSGALRLTAPDTAAVGAYTPGTPAGVSGDCGPDIGDPVGGDLAPGSVPPQFAPWLQKAGRLCPQIRPSLLAADLKHESGFDPRAVSPMGAQGAAQFMPYTWPGYGRDDDGNGNASPFDIGDAVMAQGRYLCEIAAQVDGWIAAGKVTAPDGATELYLAGYNAGPGAVLRNGGFPADAADYHVQTRPYVDAILADEPRFAAVNR